VRLVLAPALVQGEGAPESLIGAIDRLERYPGLDLLIIGRGGGSGEDLMAFNDERVVRRIAATRVPVVSAVGHEVDVSLADLAADVRAATPSQAAELVVPDSAARRHAVSSVELALARAMRRRLRDARAGVDRTRSKLADPRFLIAARQQELDELETRLRRQLDRSLFRNGQALGGLLGRLLSRHPRAVISRDRGRLGPLAERLRASMQLGLGRRRAALSLCAGRLESLSPLAVLSRGYAVALDPDGRAVRRFDELHLGDRLRLLLHRGSLDVRVEALSPPSEVNE
jgi:exodeoxyribonuclease VII large subunit